MIYKFQMLNWPYFKDILRSRAYRHRIKITFCDIRNNITNFKTGSVNFYYRITDYIIPNHLILRQKAITY